MQVLALDHTDNNLAREIHALQQRSYRVEAELIGFEDIPLLKETVEQLRQSAERFFGIRVGEVLAGFVAVEQENGTLDICRVAVHPDYFRRGIGRELIGYALSLPGVCTATVSTGEANYPALKLYESMGFVRISYREVALGVRLCTLVRGKPTKTT